MNRGRRKRWLYVLVVAAILGMFSSIVWAEEAYVSFHGYLEASAVLRDGGGDGLGRRSGSGFQYGFMDHLSLVQQRNTLKFDIDVEPNMAWGAVELKKIHLTYRGAYDSIFDLRKDEYGNIPENRGLSRFDYGLKDIRFESDLREAFIDVTYNGPLGSAFFRPGRQLVSWGETSGSILLDVVNPKDNSFQMYFQNPDDLSIPIYMGRLNYSIPMQPGFGLNFDLLWIPDIRPSQYAPLDKSMSAPYISILTGFSNMGRFKSVQYDVPTEKQEYGAKIMADIGQNLSVSLVYFRDVNNNPGVVFSPAPPVSPANSNVYLTFNEQDVYGGYFSYYFEPLSVVIRGELARQSAQPISLPGTIMDSYDDHGLQGLATFRYKPLTLWSIGFDKKVTIPWVSSQETGFSAQWIHKYIGKWDEDLDNTNNTKTVDLLSLQVTTSWFSGYIEPLFLVRVDPGRSGEGGSTTMTQAIVNFQLTKNFYLNTQLIAFWGDKDAKSGYANLIGTSEVTFKLGYEW